MFRPLIAAITGALVLIILSGCQATPSAYQETAWYVAPVETSGPLRIGVVQRAPLLRAYYGSTLHHDWVTQLQVQRDRAIAMGDTRAVSQLNAEGRAAQELAHLQVQGVAPLSNIVQRLEPEFSRLAQEQGVDLITEAGIVQDPSVRIVDITDEVISCFTPAQTP